MNKKIELEKKLSWLLRHGAKESGLKMDEAGFSAIHDVLQIMNIEKEELQQIVFDSQKSRYQIKDHDIRAVQGHSDGTPVTLEGLEKSWQIYLGDEELFHGTSVEAAKAIMSSAGINSVTRTHVHLAAAIDSKVGKRAAVDVMFEIDPHVMRQSGHPIYIAPNGVYLCRFVPKSAIKNIVPISKNDILHFEELKT